jgi:hypothetical protein
MNSLRYLLVVAVMLSASLVFPQQPQTTPPPESTPPTFPSDKAAPPASQTPDQEKPSRALTSDEAKSEIVQKLQTEPGLSSRDIKVEVMKDTVVLSGSVPTQNDRAVAQRIAQSYAGEKRIENRLVIATEDDMNKAKKQR